MSIKVRTDAEALRRLASAYLHRRFFRTAWKPDELDPCVVPVSLRPACDPSGMTPLFQTVDGELHPLVEATAIFPDDPTGLRWRGTLRQWYRTLEREASTGVSDGAQDPL